MTFLSILSGIGCVFLPILAFVLTLVFLVMGENDLGHGLTRPAAGTNFWRRMWHWMKGASWQGWLTAIIAAVITAGSSLFILAVKPRVWALIPWALLLATLAYVEYDWYHRSGALRTRLMRRYLLSWVLFLVGMLPGVAVFLLATTEVSDSAVWMTIGEILAAEVLCVFVVLFCQRNVVATRNSRWKKVKVAAIVLAVLVAIVIILANINWGGGTGTTPDTETPTTEAPTETPTTEAPTEAPTTEVPTEAPTEAQVQLDPRFVQEKTPHEKWRLCFNFSDHIRDSVERDLRVEIIPDDTSEAILGVSGHDAELLAIYAWGFGLIPDSNQYEGLMTQDGTYLSDEGIILYYKLEGALDVCKKERTNAPADGTNTGYDGGFVVADQAGISGDTSATKYTTPTGQEIYVMDRCGNFVYPDPPKDIPTGNTDQKKDPSLGTKIGEYHADSPGTNTNDGVGAKSSKVDSPTNSGSKTPAEYKAAVKELDEVAAGQQVGGDSNTPSTPTPSGASVSNNAVTGTGNGGINVPTPTTPPEPEIATDSAGGEWGGPSD